VITVFPQPALTTAIQATLYGLDVPLLAWCFNLGGYPHGLKRVGARMALRSVDRFVVHSTAEIDRVSEFLDLAPGKVEFVPLQRAPIPIEAEEDVISPFIVALGSANRDYETFFKAAEISKLPCKVVASPRALAGLRLPPNVSVGHGLAPTQCHRLVQQSRFSVVVVHDPNIASGQVTVIESMRMNTPVIATSSIGTTDYIQQHYSGTLVPPHDPERLAAAMLELWHDAPLRDRYAHNAAEFAENSLSDEAAARALARIISELELER
jgi:glycosyltransferase involved in cell wall biosynthesis